jgi:hypothetical protein
MMSRRGITKLKAILIIDLIIVAAAASVFIYRQQHAVALKPAEFTVSDFTIDPLEAEAGQPVLVFYNVTNTGDIEGVYSANLTINNLLKDNQTILLSGGDSTLVEFLVIENAEGHYAVEINGFSGSFTIKPAAPETSNIVLSNLRITPYETWVNTPVSVSLTAQNPSDDADSITIRVMVDDVLAEIKRIELLGKQTTTVEFTVNATTEGRRIIRVNTLSGAIMIVPQGYHTLMISRSGAGSGTVPFTLNGENAVIPFSDLMPVGTHTISVPSMFDTATAVFRFDYWSDGVTSSSRTINLDSRTVLVAQYTIISGVASCPSLFVWNGTNYMYRTEISSGTGYLGIFDYFREDGSLAFLYSDPWDYIKIDNIMIEPRNGYYDMALTQLWDEIFYIDTVKLIAVDHAPNVDVFSTKGTYLYALDDLGTIYTVSKNPSPPVSAFSIGADGERTCVLSQIYALDEVKTSGNEFHWDTLELDLGDLSGAEEIKLVVGGVIVYSSGEEQGNWASQFYDKPEERPFPPPYMEVKIGDEWVRVPDNRQFPLLLVTPESFVVDLTGLFPANTTEYLIRIHTWFDSRFDYIRVDTTPQDMTIQTQTIYPDYADFTQAFVPSHVTSTGNFTRYGDVTELLLEADNRFVIGRKGDSLKLLFNVTEFGPVPEGMERDYFVVVSCWFKVPGLPYLPFTVDPLPFHDMSSFPYPHTENYPYNEANLSYLEEYNIRTIILP